VHEPPTHVFMGDQIHGDKYSVRGPGAIGKQVFSGPPLSTPEPAARHTVLVLRSSPADTVQLRVEREFHEIDKAISASRFRDRIDLKLGAALRRGDLQDLLLRHRPMLVHYAGHSAVNGIALTGDDGRTEAVAPPALVDLFRIVGKSIECVVLNGCYTASQAAAIAAYVSCVVGMSGSVLDDVAITFAAGFHRAIAEGESMADAFRWGVNGVIQSGEDPKDPVLIGARDRVSRPLFGR
jgi:hypothetical protein